MENNEPTTTVDTWVPMICVISSQSRYLGNASDGALVEYEYKFLSELPRDVAGLIVKEVVGFYPHPPDLLWDTGAVLQDVPVILKVEVNIKGQKNAVWYTNYIPGTLWFFFNSDAIIFGNLPYIWRVYFNVIGRYV